MLSIADAQHQLHQALQEPAARRKTEPRHLLTARGCVLAEEAIASVDVPPADVSAMDGYAVAWETLQQQQVIPISQRIPAGHRAQPLESGTAARIFTGSVIPPGADTVIMQENCQRDGNTISVLEPGKPNNHIRPRGQDFYRGQTLLPRGHTLRAQDLGLLASAGITQVLVNSPLKIAILSTGDELTEPGEPLTEGKIYNSNRFTLSGLIHSLGMEVLDFGHIKDNLVDTISALKQAAGRADVVISTGGVSVGEEDHVKPAVETLGELQLWKLAIKPGKPLAYGRIGDTPFFGLPGNPVAVFVTFIVLVRGYLLSLQGHEKHRLTITSARANFEQTNTNSRQEYIRVQVADGQIHQYRSQDSGVLSSTAWANALAVIPPATKVAKGDTLEVILFDTLNL